VVLLTVYRLEAELTRLNIDWERITGHWNFEEVFKAFDVDGSGAIDIRELVGWGQLSTSSFEVKGSFRSKATPPMLSGSSTSTTSRKPHQG
jgi:hypothetical protein